jgi:hypothetical protein
MSLRHRCSSVSIHRLLQLSHVPATQMLFCLLCLYRPQATSVISYACNTDALLCLYTGYSSYLISLQYGCSSVSLHRPVSYCPAVVFWLGFWFWWEHPGAELGRFFAPLAVVGTGVDQPPSGVVGGGPRVTRRCPRRCGADLCPWPGGGGRFFSMGVLPPEISG